MFASSRCSTPTAARWRSFIPTTSSATTRAAARGWTASSISRACSARSPSSSTSRTSPKPAAGQPALLSFDDVTTLFHEFGHALHGMFSRVRYPMLAGTNVPRDFVEFPSQFNEHWALEPTVFARYARHHETGEPMPQALVDRIKKARKFNQGFALTEYISAALIDMSWHTLPVGTPPRDFDAFEADVLSRYRMDLHVVPPRYRTTLLRAHLGWWVPSGLLRLSLGRGPRPGCVRMVQGARRHDSRERSAIPRNDSVARRNVRGGRIVSRIPWTRPERRTPARRTGTRAGEPWRQTPEPESSE